MENISPTLRAATILRSRIEQGDSMRTALQFYLASTQDEMSNLTAKWLAHFDRGVSAETAIAKENNLYRRSLCIVFERGLSGETVLEQLAQLESEILESCLDEVSKFVAVLPYKMLFPLLICMFPAYLLLLFGPILVQLAAAMN